MFPLIFKIHDVVVYQESETGLEDLDAMIVRIYLVPAIMLLLQKWNWYAPGRLQRVRRWQKGAKALKRP